MRAGKRLAAGFLLAAGGALLLHGQDSEDWSLSPEAYFLTSGERADWKKLGSRDSRHDFIEAYWLKRDPTPGTPSNEFRETVLARIKTADARFRIATTPGSRTGRGKVFIVLGTPARVQDSLNPQAEAPRVQAPGVPFVPLEMAPPNETNSVWTWDRERTPRILEVLGRPSLEIRLLVEPNRRRDQILDPGLFDEIRETLARRSIVNPELVPPGSETAAPPESESAPPRMVLRPEVRSVLESPPAASGDGNVGGAVLWRDSGPASALLWAFTRTSPKQPRLHALVRAADGSEAASFSEPAEPSRSFSSLTPGFTCVRRLALAPGSYTANVALTGEDGKVLASSAVALEVPALQKGFAVSSLVLTRGPADAVPGNDPTFVIGQTVLPPRADRSFSTSERLWYFVEVANPSDAQSVTFEPRLRRGVEPLAQLAPFAVKLQPVGPGRSLAGIEMSLEGLEPGGYTLYLRVADRGGTDALRRADFQLVR